MLRPAFQKLLLRPEDFTPSRDDFEVIGAFNPGAVLVGNEVVLLVRVAERPRKERDGFTELPRWSPESGLISVSISDTELDRNDSRVVRKLDDGLVRLTFVSHLRVVRCGDGRRVESITDVRFAPQNEIEEFGVEDPRITQIGDRYYFTYVAVSRHGVATALASTRDFQTFERHGVIFSPENKDVVLFPKRIHDNYVALHRPNGATPFTRPKMWIARSPDLIHWGQHEPLYGGQALWESGRTGAGTPPIRTSEGWLEIYHGNRPGTRPGEVGSYSAGAMLLDADNGARIQRWASEPLMHPAAPFERLGFVPDVVFPTGIVQAGETVLVYYGAADTYTAVVELSLADILAALHR